MRLRKHSPIRPHLKGRSPMKNAELPRSRAPFLWPKRIFTVRKRMSFDRRPPSIKREADVANAEQGVSRAKAEWTYASNNLHRLEPLLTKQFVTVDQVDRARTSENRTVRKP